jgi:hypothetical protein
VNDPKHNYDWMNKTKINTSLKCDHNLIHERLKNKKKIFNLMYTQNKIQYLQLDQKKQVQWKWV